MSNADEMNKLLVMVTIEKVLLDMGKPELEKVESMLISKYQCRLYNCIECPEALKSVLCELYGDNCNEILKTISDALLSNTMDLPLENFITVLRD